MVRHRQVLELTLVFPKVLCWGLYFFCCLSMISLHKSHQAHLFGDDCLVYTEINSPEDQDILQCDLAALDQWAHTWGMRFNPAKCTVLRISRSKSPFTRMYQLCGKVLREESEAKYTAMTINNTLSWSSHVGVVAKKASNTLNFARRNLKYCPKDSK